MDKFTSQIIFDIDGASLLDISVSFSRKQSKMFFDRK